MTPDTLLDIMRYDLGLSERQGSGSNPLILEKARRVAAADPSLRWIGHFYHDDAIPWCGLQMADVVVRAGAMPVLPNPLSARAWATWGDDAGKTPLYGAIAVLTRQGGAHVALVDGVSTTGAHVRLIGGNQGDRVSRNWFVKTRIVALRAPRGVVLPPAPVLHIDNALSTTEA